MSRGLTFSIQGADAQEAGEAFQNALADMELEPALRVETGGEADKAKKDAALAGLVVGIIGVLVAIPGARLAMLQLKDRSMKEQLENRQRAVKILEAAKTACEGRNADISVETPERTTSLKLLTEDEFVEMVNKV